MYCCYVSGFPSPNCTITRKLSSWHLICRHKFCSLPQSILIIIIKKFLAIPYKSSCSSGIFVLFTVSPCTILFSCLSLSPISCIGICLSTRSWWYWLTWFLGHSNVLINMTVIIPPMTKHARLRHNSLPENIFLLFHSLRNFLAKKQRKSQCKLLFVICCSE